MDPRYRFTLVVSLILVTWWVWVFVSTFLMGPRGLNWDRYQQGIVLLSLAVWLGFMMVWLANRLIAWQRQRATGFEAETHDEFGTAFQMLNSAGQSEPFSIALSKFQPALVAPPAADADLHPLEAELIGFLHGYRSWPANPTNHDISLYEQALARWNVMRHIPNTGVWHRVAALARDLSILHALEERRVPPKWYQLLKRDVITFKRRSVTRPGMSALILSTMPAFRRLQHDAEGVAVQRSLLAALRYANNPQQMPVNTGPLAASLLEGLARAEAQLGLIDISELDQLTPVRKAMLEQALDETWLGLLAQQEPASSLNPTTTLYRGGTTGNVQHWLKLDTLLTALGPQLNAELRSVLDLWDAPTGDPRRHPSWSQIGPLLQERKLIDDSYHGVGADAGTFRLALAPSAHGTAEGADIWGPAVLLNLNSPTTAALLQKWQALPSGESADLALDLTLLKNRAEAGLQRLDARLRETF